MKHDFDRMISRAPGVGRRRGNGGAICHARGGRWAGRFADRGSLVEFFVKSFEHAGGLLAARDAEVEPPLLLQDDDVRIVLAVIAALAAILLSHRRHHPPPQRTAVGKLHAFGERQRLVVPRRLPVVAVIEWSLDGGDQSRHQRGVRLRREGGDARAVKPEKPGKEAIEPCTLLRGERGAIGNQFCDRRRRRLSHSTAPRSNMALNASSSWRRVNAANVSRSEARYAR